MKAIVLLQHNYRINSDFALAADALAKKMPELTAKAFSANGLDQKRVEVWSNESDETKRYLRITFLTDSLVTHDVVAKADITKRVEEFFNEFFHNRNGGGPKFNLKVIIAECL